MVEPSRRSALMRAVTVVGAGAAAAALTLVGGARPAHASTQTATPSRQAVDTVSAGYWLVARDGGIFPFGAAGGYGSTGGMHLNQPIVGMAATPDGGGYWLVASDGGIFPFGNAAGYGSTGAVHLNQPIVGMAATPDGGGYWLVARDGGIFPFGDAAGYGSTGALRLNQPIVGMASTPRGDGYWLVASDGGIFPFGSAAGYGSTGNIRLNQPIVAMAPTADGGGYWLVASDGGIFPFGDAPGYGSTGGIRLNQPIVGMAPTFDGGGYWLVASDGGLFPFGNAPGYGSTGGMQLNQPIVGMAAAPAHPTSLSFAPSSPSSFSADTGAAGFPLTVSLVDGSGNGVPHVTLSVTTSLAFGSVPSTVTTDGTGHAVIPVHDTVANDTGTVSVAVVSGSAHATSPSLTLTPGAPAHVTATTLAGTVTADAGRAGVPVGFRVSDAEGNVVPGVVLDLTTSLAHGATAPAAPHSATNGIASSTLTDTVAGDTGTVTGTVHGTTVRGSTAAFTITPGAPSAVAASPAGATSYTADATKAGQALTFTLTDAEGNSIAGRQVDITSTGFSGGPIAPSSPTTDSAGHVSTTLKDTVAGDTGTATGTLHGTSVAGTTGTITITPGAFAKLALAAPGTQRVGIAFADNLSATDAEGNAVNPSGTVTLSGTALAPAPDTTAASSQAPAFSGGVSALSVTSEKASSAATLSATLGSVSSNTATFAISPGPATTLLAGSTSTAYSTSGHTVTVGSAAQSVPFTVTLEDAHGNVETGATDVVRATLTPGTNPSNPDGGSLTGTAGTPSASDSTGGVSTTVNLASGSGTLTYGGPATIPPSGTGSISLADTTTGGLTYAPASVAVVATQVRTITVAPATATTTTTDVGGTGEPVTFTVHDAGNLPVKGALLDFTASSGLAHGGLSPGFATTDVNGQATTTLTDTTAGDSGVVTGTVRGSTVTVSSGAFTFNVGTPAAVTATPGSATSISADTSGSGTPVVFTVVDGHGNPVQGVSVTATTSLARATITAPTTATSAADGTVSFTVVDKVAGDSGTVTGTVGGTSPSGSTGTLTITPGAPATVVATAPTTAQTPNADAASTTGVPVAFRVVDQYANPVPGTTVSLVAGLTHATLVPANPVTDSSGVASAVLKDGHAGDSGTVSGTVGTLPSATTASITVSPGAPVTVAATPSQPANASADTAGGSGYVLGFRVTDREGNPIPSVGLTYSQSSFTHATIPGAGTTAADGTTAPALVDKVAGDAGTVTATVTANNAVHGTTATISIVAGAAAAVVASPTTATAVTADTAHSPGVPVTFTVTDRNGNAVSGATVAATTTLPNGTLTAANPTTDGSGVASTTLNDSKAGDQGVVAGTVGTLPAANTGQITVGPGTAAVMTASPSTATSFSADTGAIACTFTVSDAEGNRISGSTVGFSTTLANGVPAAPSKATDATGTVTVSVADTRAGDSGTVTGTVSSLHATTATLTVTSGAASQVVVVSPTTATNVSADTGATTTGYPVTFKVEDRNGNGVSGVQVTYSTSGFTFGTTSSASGVSASDGTVSTGLRDPRAQDKGTVNASISSPTASVSTPVLTIVPGAYSALSITTPTSPQTAGTPYNVTVTAKDAENNPTNPTGATFAFSGTAMATGPDGTSTSSASLTPANFTNGAASVSVTSQKAQTGAVLTVSSTTPTATASTAGFTIVPGSITRVALTSTSPNWNAGTSTYTEPTGATSGSIVFTVTAADAAGNADTSGSHASDTVTVTLAAGTGTGVTPDGGTISGGSSGTGTDGVGSVSVVLTNGVGSFTYTAPATPATGTGRGTITAADSPLTSATANIHD